jgi:hypothetical protein
MRVRGQKRVRSGTSITVSSTSCFATLSATGLTCTKSLRLGADSIGGSQLSGIVDEVTLYDRPLTDSELMAITNTGAAGKCKQ